MSIDTLLTYHQSPIFAAKQIMNELRAEIKDFNAWWVPLAIDCRVYPLPVPAKETDTNMPWLPSLDEIRFDTINGVDALNIAESALINFHRHPQDPALNIRRWPGYVRLPASSRLRMVEYLTKINQLKDALKDALSVIPDGSRPVVLKKTFPGEHILAAYRHIHFADFNVEHLSYTWVGKTAKNTIVDKTDLLEKLRSDKSIRIEDQDLVGAEMIDKEINKVLSIDALDLVKRKRHAPSPQLAVFSTNKTENSKWDMLMQAPLPFFIAQDEAMFVRDLPSWSSKDTNNGLRSAQYDPVVMRHHVFSRRSKNVTKTV
jgi:hypothetical protein